MLCTIYANKCSSFEEEHGVDLMLVDVLYSVVQ